jgi:hypothetical protein
VTPSCGSDQDGLGYDDTCYITTPSLPGEI